MGNMVLQGSFHIIVHPWAGRSRVVLTVFFGWLFNLLWACICLQAGDLEKREWRSLPDENIGRVHIAVKEVIHSISQCGALMQVLIVFARFHPACYHVNHSIQELMMHISLRGCAAVCLTILVSTPVFASELSVAVAANFAAPMERIAELFHKESGHTVKLSPAASGKLYIQIKGGAPFDVLLSADEEIPKRLLQEGLAVAGSRFIYATGRLVLWSAQPGLVDEKGGVLNTGNFDKLAYANPAFSPYGVATRETLTKLTMWNAMQKKLKKGDDVTQAYQLAASESADMAFIALSQLMRDGKVSTGSWWLVPAELHHPIRQSAVLLSGAKDQAAAKALLTFLKSEKARAVMRGFGYELP